MEGNILLDRPIQGDLTICRPLTSHVHKSAHALVKSDGVDHTKEVP